VTVFKKQGTIDGQYYSELLSEYGKDKILFSCILAGEWLVKNQHEDGRFNYEYYPSQDRYSLGYNIIRHASTTYSLAKLYRDTRLTEFMECTLKGIKYLQKHLRISPFGKYVDDGFYPIHLGSTALAILAMIEYEEVTNDTSFVDDINEMGEFLKAQQNPDGSLNCYYYSDKNVSYGLDDYYMGESVLAAVRLYEFTGSYDYYVFLEKAFSYCKDYYMDKGLNPFAPWGVEAFVRWYKYSKDSEVLDFCYRISDDILEHQYLPGDDCPSDYIGGFGKIKSRVPGASTASDIEAVVDTYYLANITNNKTKMSQYKDNIILAVEFLMNLQIDKNDALKYPNPGRALGAIPLTLSNSKIRIDHMQHTIVTLLKIRDYGIET